MKDSLKIWWLFIGILIAIAIIFVNWNDVSNQLSGYIQVLFNNG